jgi:hypothetical protein
LNKYQIAFWKCNSSKGSSRTIGSFEIVFVIILLYKLQKVLNPYDFSINKIKQFFFVPIWIKTWDVTVILSSPSFGGEHPNRKNLTRLIPFNSAPILPLPRAYKDPSLLHTSSTQKP